MLQQRKGQPDVLEYTPESDEPMGLIECVVVSVFGLGVGLGVLVGTIELGLRAIAWLFGAM